MYIFNFNDRRFLIIEYIRVTFKNITNKLLPFFVKVNKLIKLLFIFLFIKIIKPEEFLVNYTTTKADKKTGMVRMPIENP